MSISKVSETILALQAELSRARDGEIMQADECLSQYITDHNNRDAWRRKDANIRQLAKAWNRMITRLDKWREQAEKIEMSCECFYGE